MNTRRHGWHIGVLAWQCLWLVPDWIILRRVCSNLSHSILGLELSLVICAKEISEGAERACLPAGRYRTEPHFRPQAAPPLLSIRFCSASNGIFVVRPCRLGGVDHENAFLIHNAMNACMESAALRELAVPAAFTRGWRYAKHEKCSLSSIWFQNQLDSKTF